MHTETAAQPTAPQASKVVFVANSDWYLYNFRSNLIAATVDAGWAVELICTDGKYVDRLRARGWPATVVPLETRGSNPLREAVAWFKLVHALRKSAPDVVHLFTLKCVLYGTLAAPFIRRPRIIGALTGMGYLFTSNKVKVRALKYAVLLALKLGLKLSRAELIFQNDFDRDEFLGHKMLPASRTHVIRGSGVDCERFNSLRRDAPSGGPLRLLFCGRLISEKGIRDYLAATEKLQAAGYEFQSIIAGEPYPGNPSSLSDREVADLHQNPLHDYVGHRDDMATLLSGVDVVVLPTYYREGTPKVLLEAAAAGCIIVTTNIPACAGIVEQGKNGFYVEPRTPDGIFQAVQRIAECSDADRAQMRAHSCQIAIARFSDAEVNRRTMALYAMT